jgi:hypothetical protein
MMPALLRGPLRLDDQLDWNVEAPIARTLPERTTSESAQ